MDPLVIDNIQKSFRETKAVRTLSATVPAGCIYGFLGPNGAGKTTCIRMVLDIISPDAGSIILFGENSARHVKSRIGYMPEERGLYRKMRVREVLAYVGGIKGMPRAELARRIPEWLERVGLAEQAHQRVEELSRGMHQKLQFVATIINDPELLILDEPFSGLDPVNLDLLKEIMVDMREEGKTVVFSTHMMEQAEQLCDSILLINQGEKILDGKLSDIRARYKSNTILAELEGDTAFVAELPMVASVQNENHTLQISLAGGNADQELLQALIERVRVKRFEVQVPTLRSIFVQSVGVNDE